MHQRKILMIYAIKAPMKNIHDFCYEGTKGKIFMIYSIKEGKYSWCMLWMYQKKIVMIYAMKAPKDSWFMIYAIKAPKESIHDLCNNGTNETIHGLCYEGTKEEYSC